MSEFLKSAVVWKLAWFKGINGWFTVVAMTFIGGADQLGFDPVTLKRITFFLAVLIAGNKFIDGFVDSTVQNLRLAKNPLGVHLGSGDTDFVRRTAVESPGAATPAPTPTASPGDKKGYL